MWGKNVNLKELPSALGLGTLSLLNLGTKALANDRVEPEYV